MGWFVSGAGPTFAGCFAHTYTSKWQLQDPSFGMWARLDAMTRPEETKTPIKPVIMLGSCGDKAQVYVTQTRVGRSGQHYTHALGVHALPRRRREHQRRLPDRDGDRWARHGDADEYGRARATERHVQVPEDWQVVGGGPPHDHAALGWDHKYT